MFFSPYLSIVSLFHRLKLLDLQREKTKFKTRKSSILDHGKAISTQWIARCQDGFDSISGTVRTQLMNADVFFLPGLLGLNDSISLYIDIP